MNIEKANYCIEDINYKIKFYNDELKNEFVGYHRQAQLEDIISGLLIAKSIIIKNFDLKSE